MIAVISDDTDTLDSSRLVLQAAGHALVAGFADVQDLLVAAPAAARCVVLIMSRRHALAQLELLRGSGIWAPAILLVSARIDAQLAEAARRLAVSTMIQQPHRSADLLAAVGSAIAGQQPGSNDNLGA